MVPSHSQASESLESFWKYILSKLPHLTSPPLSRTWFHCPSWGRNLYFSKHDRMPSALGVWEPLERNGPESGVARFDIEGQLPVTSLFPLCASPWLESPPRWSWLQPRQQWPCESCSWSWALAACPPALAISVWRWEARMAYLIFEEVWVISRRFSKRCVFNRLF